MSEAPFDDSPNKEMGKEETVLGLLALAGDSSILFLLPSFAGNRGSFFGSQVFSSTRLAL